MGSFIKKDLVKNGPACLSFASRIAEVYLKNKPIPLYCPAGFGDLSVDAKGNISPCFMFTGIEDFTMGNVFSETFIQNRRAANIYETLISNDKTNYLECKKCWAAPFCSGCIGADYISSGGSFKKTACDVTKAMVDGFLSEIVKFADLVGKEDSEPKLSIDDETANKLVN